MAAAANVEVQRDGDATIFTVTPGGARRKWSLVWTGITLALTGYWTVWAAGILSWFIVVCGVASVFLGLADSRPKTHRSKSVIRVSPRGFEVNSKLYARNSVKRLFLRNPLAPNDPPAREIVVIVGPDADGAAMRSQIQDGARREEEKVAAGTYEIVLDADYKDTVIAGNLALQPADRLLRSLCDASGLIYKG